MAGSIVRAVLFCSLTYNPVKQKFHVRGERGSSGIASLAAWDPVAT